MSKQTTWAALRRSNTCYLSTKLCENAAVTSNLGGDLELSESIECELLTSEVESEIELKIGKEATVFRTRRSLRRQAVCRWKLT